MEFRLIRCAIIAVCLFGNHVLFAQNAQEVFGKNKVQYNKDQADWWIYETSNLVYYWYGKGRNAAHFFINLAEEENQKVLGLFEYHPKEKIELIIYSDLSDLHQSNLDLSHFHTPKLWNLEPRTKEQKILVYFDGDHQHALKLLRKGLVQVYFNSMFSGTNFQEVIQKVISYKLPPWFETGLTEYLGEGWTAKDLTLLSGVWNQKKNFRNFSSRYPSFAGKSFWNFIVSQYGDKSIPNWLYLIRIQKDLAQATRMVFQRDLNELFDEWAGHYQRELSGSETSLPESRRIRLKKEEQIHRLSYSENHKGWVLVTDQNNRKRIRIFSRDLSERRTIYRSGHRNKINVPDPGYPVYAEHPGEKFSVIADEIRNRIRITMTDLLTGETVKTWLPDDITAVYDLAALDRNQLVFSGSTNGFSDLFLYRIKSRSYQKLTDDLYDDLSIELVKTQEGTFAYFNSNRTSGELVKYRLDSILPTGPFSVFRLKIPDSSRQLTKLRAPFLNGSLDELKVINPEMLLLKATHAGGENHYISGINTSYDLSHPQLDKLSAQERDPYLLNIFRDWKGRYFGRVEDLNTRIKSAPQIEEGKGFTPGDSSEVPLQLPVDTQQLTRYQSPFGDPANVREILLNFFQKKKIDYNEISLGTNVQSRQNRIPLTQFNPNQAIAYRDRFQIEETSANLNNDLLFGGLNTFAGFNRNFVPPRLGLLLKLRVREIFENYHIEAGIRIPTNLSGTESYLLFQNQKNRFDHIFALYRKGESETIPVSNFTNYRQTTNTVLFNYQLLYALDPYRSIRLNNTLRNDHRYFNATDRITLDSSGTHLQSLGTRLEFVYDDALGLSINLKQGTQIKVFMEVMKRFQLSRNEGWNFKAVDGMLYIAGFDARHHIPVLRHSVFSNRLYFNSSFGGLRMLNHLGGTENWIIPRYSTENNTGDNLNYAFANQVTEVRGFPLGARRGSSSMVFSSELRIPFFQYILGHSWRNSVLRNLQLVGFVDAGMSWNGFLPDLRKAEIVSARVSNPAVEVDLKFKRNPVISSTGLGLRGALFGYFVRFDYGWPFDLKGLQKPMAHLSLGLDF